MFSEVEENRNSPVINRLVCRFITDELVIIYFVKPLGEEKLKTQFQLFLFSWQSAFITSGSKKQKSKTYIKIVE